MGRNLIYSLRRLVCIFLSPLIYLVAILLPKKNSRYCFGAWFGRAYSDNSRYLFEAANDYDDIDAIWITKSIQVENSLRRMGLSVHNAYSLSGMFYQLTSEVMFCSVNSRDLNPFCIGPKTKLIQLWHGLPLKKIGYDVKITGLKRLKRWLRQKTVDNYSGIISPSSLFDKIFMSAFNMPEEKIIRSPYPRCVGMFQLENSQTKLKKMYGVLSGKKVALYLPTHRDEGKSITVISDTVSELVKHDNLLEKLDLQIIVKLHFYDLKFIDHLKSSKNVILIYENIDIYPLLAISDSLVTDYSSVIFDYYYLNKPIIIHAPDVFEYKRKNRDLYLDICNIFSPDSETVEELLDQLESSVINNQSGELVFQSQNSGLVAVDDNQFGRDCFLSIRNYLMDH